MLLGITGSGKTFTMANVIEKIQRPTLVMAHNKTLAPQLYCEFKELFPDNAVQYFVSYYDYYQPEAYVPSTDTYIEKDSIINEEIDRMRHAATYALLSRRDVIIVASVSCIYGIGAAEAYLGMKLDLDARGRGPARRACCAGWSRSSTSATTSTFTAARSACAATSSRSSRPTSGRRRIRIEWFGDEIEAISRGRSAARQGAAQDRRGARSSPARTTSRRPTSCRAPIDRASKKSCASASTQLKAENKLLEEQRLEQRTMYDLEMLEQMGCCNGIENYSRHLSGRAPGEPPPTLIDYFPKDFLLFVDESHQTVPQIASMYSGDRSRKETLVEFGFRLPSALDNRPLRFDEWEARAQQAIYVSATPAEYELQRSEGVVVEQIIRPTGLLDPEIEVRPVGSQVDDLLGEIRERIKMGERVLVTTLTKRMAEDLTEYYTELGVRVRYLHSDIDTLERIEILRDLRLRRVRRARRHQPAARGARSARGVAGRHPRRRQGRLPARRALADPDDRARGAQRARQGHHVRRPRDRLDAQGDHGHSRAPRRAGRAQPAHGITPKTIEKAIAALAGTPQDDYVDLTRAAKEAANNEVALEELPRTITALKKQMLELSEELEFEKAAAIRDRIKDLEEIRLSLGG